MKPTLQTILSHAAVMQKHSRYRQCESYLFVGDACEDSLLVAQLYFQVHEGELVVGDLELAVRKQNPREPSVALHRHRDVFTGLVAPLKPAKNTKKTVRSAGNPKKQRNYQETT